jgi:hypothetical protein
MPVACEPQEDHVGWVDELAAMAVLIATIELA